MKRKGFLYDSMCDLKNITNAFNEVCKNTKNKDKVLKFKEYRCINIFRIYMDLKNRTYRPQKPHVFTIYEPKKRRIVSQCMYDKVINHLISRQILIPSICNCLIETNVASIPGKGVSAGLKYYFDYRRICKLKYKNYYILKGDVKSFFASIDHDILKQKLLKRIKDKDALKIVYDVIDNEDKGLGIGNMTSQLLAIFYLNDFDHFIKEVLKIKYYVRYQDDFILFHQSKEYLKYCLLELNDFLTREKLELNKKTRIYTCKDNFLFLGRNIYGKYGRYRTVKRKIKKRLYLYQTKQIPFSSLMSCINNFKTYLLNFELVGLGDVH